MPARASARLQRLTATVLPADTLTVELVQADETRPSSSSKRPAKATVFHPRRFPQARMLPHAYWTPRSSSWRRSAGIGGFENKSSTGQNSCIPIVSECGSDDDSERGSARPVLGD